MRLLSVAEISHLPVTHDPFTSIVNKFRNGFSLKKKLFFNLGKINSRSRGPDIFEFPAACIFLSLFRRAPGNSLGRRPSLPPAEMPTRTAPAVPGVQRVAASAVRITLTSSGIIATSAVRKGGRKSDFAFFHSFPSPACFFPPVFAKGYWLRSFWESVPGPWNRH